MQPRFDASWRCRCPRCRRKVRLGRIDRGAWALRRDQARLALVPDSTLTGAGFLTAFGFGSADAVAGFRLTGPGFDCDGAATAGAGGGAARAASSIQPLALLFKSWIWTKPPSRPMTRNGRPAGKPYMAGAEADGLASTSTGFLETRIMPAPGKSACSVCSTASPSGLVCSAVSAACSAGSVGAGAASCVAGGVLGMDSVVSAGGGDAASGAGTGTATGAGASTAAGSFCAAFQPK